jgi:hypothetical protein
MSEMANELIEKIARKDFDVDAFVQLALQNESVREEIVNQMLTNPAIMVYYHCYYVIEKASRKNPELFYPYWDDIAALLHHQNSYHRDFALEIIGNLTKVDQANQFAEVKRNYFDLVNDKKFMTGNCCLRNLLKIYQNKAELHDEIIELLLDIDNRCDYTEKQKAVLNADVLKIFDVFYEEAGRREEIDQFIRTQVESISPKTRKKAKELVKKYNLIEPIK